MEISTLIIGIGALLMILVLIKIALGITKTVAKVALIALAVLIIAMVLMKIGVLPDINHKMTEIKTVAEEKLHEIKNVSLPINQESNETPKEEDSQYPPGYNQSNDQDAPAHA